MFWYIPHLSEAQCNGTSPSFHQLSRTSSFRISLTFYICISIRRNSSLKKSNKMKLYADIYLLLIYSTCFRRPSRPSSGVHKTVVAAYGTDHTIWEATVVCTPDDGCDGRPQHVEKFSSK